MADTDQQDGPTKSHRSGDFNNLKACTINALADHSPQGAALSTHETASAVYTEVRMSDGPDNVSVYLAPKTDPRNFTVKVEGYGSHGSISENGYVGSDGKVKITNPKLLPYESHKETFVNGIAREIQHCVDSNKTTAPQKKAVLNFKP